MNDVTCQIHLSTKFLWCKPWVDDVARYVDCNERRGCDLCKDVETINVKRWEDKGAAGPNYSKNWVT